MKKKAKPQHFIAKPSYPGGNKALSEFIGKSMRYPQEALKKMIEGTVVVKLDINHKGEVIRTRIKQSLGYGCDEEAERIVRQLKFEVAKNRGVIVTFHKTMNINFRLPIAKSEPKAPAQSNAVNQVVYHYTSTSNSQKENSSSYTIDLNPANKGEA